MVTVNLSAGGDKDLLIACDPLVAVGDAVYLSMLSVVARANASAIATAPAIGFCTKKVNPTLCRIRTEKMMAGFSGLTPNEPIFLGLSSGTITQVAPSVAGQVVQNLGEAVDATSIFIDPESDVTVLA